MREFWGELFGEALTDTRRLLVFGLPSTEARHFADLGTAEAFARRLSPAQNVYFGCTLSSRFDVKHRADDAVALGGFWADIDMAGPGREGKPLPKALDEIQDFLLSPQVPFRPSVVIGSGYGVHAWWLLQEPWVFLGEEERLEASRTARGWHGLICALAAQRGWQLENLGDLGRILRPPQTLNHKGERPQLVEVYEANYGLRYSLDEFLFFADSALPVETRPVTVGTVLPAEKLTAACLASPLFKATWDRQRADLQDQSGSAYDQALADIAALREWTDEEIAALLLAFRDRHGLDTAKALRPDYLGRTIAKARRVAATREEAAKIDISGLVPPAPPTMDDPPSIRQLMAMHRSLRAPVVEGLLRRGETMNLIAQPKVGKSWLALDLGLSVATGRPWFNFQTTAGDVLILDNELHAETIAMRVPQVAEARGLSLNEYGDRIFIKSLRGQLKDLLGMGEWLRKQRAGRFALIILDAFYRFLPMRMDENDNGTMAQLYNALDAYAAALGTSFVLIHHASKGSQSEKTITDVGAGAGAQSRASDTHMTLRRHEQPGVVVAEAVTRSWLSPAPFCLRWKYPLWHLDYDANPEDLHRGR